MIGILHPMNFYQRICDAITRGMSTPLYNAAKNLRQVSELLPVHPSRKETCDLLADDDCRDDPWRSPSSSS